MRKGDDLKWLCLLLQSSEFFIKDKERLYIFFLCWIFPMAFKYPLQLIGDTQPLKVHRNNCTEFVSDYTEPWKREKTYCRSKKECCNQRLLVFCQNHASCVYQQKITRIQIKNPCSLAFICQMLELSIIFCCLQSNSQQPLAFYFLQIKIQPFFLLKA